MALITVSVKYLLSSDEIILQVYSLEADLLDFIRETQLYKNSRNIHIRVRQ